MPLTPVFGGPADDGALAEVLFELAADGRVAAVVGRAVAPQQEHAAVGVKEVAEHRDGVGQGHSHKRIAGGRRRALSVER